MRPSFTYLLPPWYCSNLALLLVNEKSISTWDDHFNFKSCKLIFVPIHLQDNEGEKSWSLAVCSLGKTDVNIFMFLSKSLSMCISQERKGIIVKVISSWLKKN